MKLNRASAVLVLLGAGLIAANPLCAQFVPTSANGGWGPSWVSGGPPGGYPRPEKVDAAITAATVVADAQPLGVSARMWADGPIEKGHEYQLLCQLRVHTIKGEFGPLLGDAAQPGGTTLLVASGKADEKWSGLEGAVDITRKELGTMTNLPTGKAVVALRVEPQLFDRTTNKYLTASKTKAIIVMIGFDSRGKVDSATSLGAWVAQNAHYQSDQVLEVLGGLDEIAAEGNKLPDAIGAALSIKELPDATKLRYVQATPKEIVHMKNPALWAALSELATNSNNGELKAAAAALLK